MSIGIIPYSTVFCNGSHLTLMFICSLGQVGQLCWNSQEVNILCQDNINHQSKESISGTKKHIKLFKQDK